MYTKNDIRELASSFQRVRAFLTGFELGVFTEIGKDSKSSADIAAALHTDPRATDRLLNALAAMKFLLKEADRFSNAPESLTYLARGGDEYLSGLMHTVNLWDRWTQLTETVRTGKPVATGGRPARSETWVRSFIGAMHDRAKVQGAMLAAMFDLGPARRMLDVGGGSGDFAMGFVKANPGMTATVFDLPDVVPLTMEYVDRQGLGDRVDTVAGDFHTDPLPAGYDVVLLSAIVHMNGHDGNARLVRKCAEALNPSGMLIILDHVMNDDRTEPLAGALFALNMLVGTPSGDTYTAAEMREWIEAAGLAWVESRETPFGNACVLGRKP
jgi:SAM-dependent methyltransferase